MFMIFRIMLTTVIKFNRINGLLFMSMTYMCKQIILIHEDLINTNLKALRNFFVERFFFFFFNNDITVSTLFDQSPHSLGLQNKLF